MKVAVATPKQAGDTWFAFPTDWKTPAEIREQVRDLVEGEGVARDAWANLSAVTGMDLGLYPEVRLCTMNRTVLDMVTSADAKCPGLLTYEDVVVHVEGEGLVPLLELREEAYLVHFELGSLYERGLLTRVR